MGNSAMAEYVTNRLDIVEPVAKLFITTTTYQKKKKKRELISLGIVPPI